MKVGEGMICGSRSRKLLQPGDLPDDIPGNLRRASQVSDMTQHTSHSLGQEIRRPQHGITATCMTSAKSPDIREENPDAEPTLSGNLPTLVPPNFCTTHGWAAELLTRHGTAIGAGALRGAAGVRMGSPGRPGTSRGRGGVVDMLPAVGSKGAAEAGGRGRGQGGVKSANKNLKKK